MAFGVTFKRYEKKYLLSPKQFEAIMIEINQRFIPDKYGETKICNLYYDTSDYLTVRRSIEKPIFKEKLRLRTYGVPADDTTAFCEVKRKFKSVVYKRRVHMPYTQAIDYLAQGFEGDDTQISREIKYLLKFYGSLEPKFYISYDRCAYFYKESSDIRITFDKNITWRNYDLDLRKGSYGEQLLPEGYTLMEVKVPNTVPLWLAQLMSEQGIRANSFSKVGNAYKRMLYKGYDIRRGYVIPEHIESITTEENVFDDIFDEHDYISQGVEE